MAHQPFTVGTNNPLLATDLNAVPLYVRSTNNADTANLLVTGMDDVPGPFDETFVLTGLLEKKSATNVTLLRAVKLAATQAGTISVFGESSAPATGDLRAETRPDDVTTLTFGVTGHTKVYTFQTTLTNVDGHVLRGADATASITNLKNAINRGTGSGTTYAASTTVNPLVSASSTGTILTLTDKIGCNRQLAWSFAQSASHFSLPSTLSGGLDGTLLALIAPGSLAAFNAFALDTEDLSTPTLPALVVPITDAIQIDGKGCTLRFLSQIMPTAAIALKYQTSTDNTNWHDGLTSITSLNNNQVVVIPGEAHIEYLRLYFTANANEGDVAVDARVIYPLV